MSLILEDWHKTGRYVEIEGRRLFVVDTETEKPALVILHGYPSSSHDYHLVLPELARHYRVIVHDHLGFGLSDKPLEYSYSLFEQTEMAQLLWLRLGITEAHVFAHDYGTSIATELVARRNIGYEPILLKSLTLCNGSIHIELANLRFIQKLLRNRLLGPVIARLSTIHVFKRNMRSLFSDPTLLSDEMFDTMWALLTFGNGRTVLPKITQYLRDRELFWHRWVGGLTRSTVPTNILWGVDDPITGQNVAELHHEEIPGSSLTLLESLGHYPMLEAPERWTEALLSMLRDRDAELLT